MSLKKTKEQAIRLLSDSEINVIAISGKWGTGKTHLWSEIKESSNDGKVKNALYVSLFGLSSIDQIKRKLIEVSIPNANSHGGIFDFLKNISQVGFSAAAEHYKTLAAIKDFNLLLMAPVVLKDKLIVIDDIERKHEKLGIDEVLGFIDDYSKRHRVRFILILNDDQLSTKGEQGSLWTTFREKVIDQELRLSTSADEAFSIAVGIVPTYYTKAIRKAVISCGLSNIRIVVKIIKTTNMILEGHNLVEAIQTRVIPSIVLFSAIHYRGLDDGPDFLFALNVGNPDWYDFTRDKNKEPTDKEKREDRWRRLLHELGITMCDNFEEVLVDYLESGLFDPESIKSIIDRYVVETDQMEARAAANDFLDRCYWDHRVEDAQLIIQAESLLPTVVLLDPYMVTELNKALSTINGGSSVGQAIINTWIENFRKLVHVDYHDHYRPRAMHDLIKAEFDAIKINIQDKTTVIDAVMSIIENSGWGTLQESALKSATAADFEAAIRGIEIDKLHLFMRRMIDMRVHKEGYEQSFGLATERFVDACKNIVKDKNSPRLARLVKRLFDDSVISTELNLVDSLHS